jgi:hypothetical protein
MTVEILINFKKQKVVHTHSKPGRKLYDSYIADGYKRIVHISGFNMSIMHLEAKHKLTRKPAKLA